MEVPDKLRARASQPPPAALERVRSFLRGYVADCDGLDEVRTELARTAQLNRKTILREAEAIQALLTAADAPPVGTLATLVAVDGNWVLDDETSDAAAAEWLAELAAMIRGVVEADGTFGR